MNRVSAIQAQVVPPRAMVGRRNPEMRLAQPHKKVTDPAKRWIPLIRV